LWPWGWLVAAILIVTLLLLSRKYKRLFWGSITLLISCLLWEFGVFLARRYGVKLADFRMIIYSLSLVLMMLLRPQGLLGGRELWFRRGLWRRRDAGPTEDRDDFGGRVEEVNA